MPADVAERNLGDECALLTPETVVQQVRARLPTFEPGGPATPLAGGYLNYVYRVPGQPRPVIVKCAPSHIATQPEVALDPLRIVIEARSLAALGQGGVLAAVAVPEVRPPRLVHFEEDGCLLIQEDVGQVPHLGEWLQQEPAGQLPAGRVGELLGEFIGRLHGQSFGDTAMAVRFDNKPIQRTRLEVQYRNTGKLLALAGVSDAEPLGQRALQLGELLQEPGLCVIHGDFWPSSILMVPDGIRLIDWELAHFGRPSQDVGHLASHLWMWSHRAGSGAAATRTHAVLSGFLRAYRRTLGSRFDQVFGSKGIHESTVHIGCEILVRAVGAFQQGYLYAGLPPDHPVIQKAVETAAQHIRSPGTVDTLEALMD